MRTPPNPAPRPPEPRSRRGSEQESGSGPCERDESQRRTVRRRAPQRRPGTRATPRPRLPAVASQTRRRPIVGPLDGFDLAATEAQNVLALKPTTPGRIQRQVEVSRRTAAGAQAVVAEEITTRRANCSRRRPRVLAMPPRRRRPSPLVSAKPKANDVKGEQVRATLRGAVGRARGRRGGQVCAWPPPSARPSRSPPRFFADKRFASAQSKERDGFAALGRFGTHGAAIRLLTEALIEYQGGGARGPAGGKRRDRQLAPLEGPPSRKRTRPWPRVGNRSAWRKADHLAQDVFVTRPRPSRSRATGQTARSLPRPLGPIRTWLMRLAQRCSARAAQTL